MPQHALDDRAIARSMRLALVDGCLFALMVGFGETYVVANGIALHATPPQLALLIALPLLLSGIGPAIVLWALRRGAARRPLCAACVLGQAITVLLLAHANWTQALTVPGLIALFAVYHMCGQGGGTAWSSWYGDLVPSV